MLVGSEGILKRFLIDFCSKCSIVGGNVKITLSPENYSTFGFSFLGYL
jgi:hypothetical protein